MTTILHLYNHHFENGLLIMGTATLLTASATTTGGSSPAVARSSGGWRPAVPLSVTAAAQELIWTPSPTIITTESTPKAGS